MAKSDVFFATAIDHCYTLETNYRYYVFKNGDKGKFGPKKFEEVGRSSLICFLEMDDLRGD